MMRLKRKIYLKNINAYAHQSVQSSLHNTHQLNLRRNLLFRVQKIIISWILKFGQLNIFIIFLKLFRFHLYKVTNVSSKNDILLENCNGILSVLVKSKQFARKMGLSVIQIFMREQWVEHFYHLFEKKDMPSPLSCSQELER